MLKLPAAGSDSVIVAVTFALSTSLTRCRSGSAQCPRCRSRPPTDWWPSARSLTAVPVIALLPVIAGATPSLTLVAMVKLPLKLAAGVNVSPPAAC